MHIETLTEQPVAVLGLGWGHSPPPSFVATHDFFAKKHKYLISLCFQILQKWANLWLPLNVQKPKVLQLQGRLPPLTP